MACFLTDAGRRTLWPQYLDAAVYVYRSSVNNSTGISPFQALYGRQPDRPLDLILGLDHEKYKNDLEYTQEITKSLHETYKILQQNQLQMALKNARLRAEKNPLDVTFSPGDMVWVWRQHDPNKMDARFDGPFKVLSRHGNSYEVDMNAPLLGIDEGDAIDHVPDPKKHTISHLRAYNPFDESIIDTAPGWFRNESQEVIWKNPSNPIQPGDMCIIPWWAWDADITKEDLPFGVGKVVSVDLLTNRLVLQRYGHYPTRLEGPYRPGWVDTRHEHRHLYKAKQPSHHIAY